MYILWMSFFPSFNKNGSDCDPFFEGEKSNFENSTAQFGWPVVRPHHLPRASDENTARIMELDAQTIRYDMLYVKPSFQQHLHKQILDFGVDKNPVD